MTTHTIDGLALSALVLLADVTVRTSAFAAVMAALAVAVRHAPAAVRLGVWRLVLVAALAMPVLGRALPGLPIDLPLLASAIAAGPVVGTGAPVGAPDSSATVVTAASVAERGRLVRWPTLVFIVYLAGAGALLVRVATGARIARRFLRETRPIGDQRLLDRVHVLSRRIGLGAAPPVHESAAARVPMSIAIAQPVIVLPGDWSFWSAVTLDAVLLHELSHVARRDPLTQRLSLVYRATTWFNPLSWWLHRRLVELGEHASDDAVLSGGVGAADYAETLVDFFAAAGTSPRRAAWHVAMASGTGAGAVRRVERVLNWSRVSTTRVGSSAVALMLVTTVPAALIAATVTPTHQALPAVRPPQQAPAPTPAVPAQIAAPPSLPSPAVAATPTHQTLPTVRPAQPAPALALGLPARIALPASVPSPAAAAVPGPEPAATTTIPLRSERPPAFTIAPSPAPAPQAHPVPARAIPGAQSQSPAPAPAAAPVAQPAPAAPEAAVAAPTRYTPDAMRERIRQEVQLQDVPTQMATVVSDEEFFKGLNLPDPKTPGFQSPRVLKEVRPSYTPEAMRANVEGTFHLQCVIMPDGTVGRARVVRIAWLNAPPIEVDAQGRRVVTELYGLDREVIRAISQWVFHPATINGQPVPFLATVMFSLRPF
jgi:beta-lactamase regulating signal transducer with metallopeptidase domain